MNFNKEPTIIDLAWNDAYGLGNNKIDNEHKNLFKIASKAFGVVNPKQKLEKIRSILKELILYTQVHFEDEESFMKSIGYPEVDTHHQLHQKIIISMKDFTNKLSTMNINEIEKELARLIEMWFIHHIIYVDKKIFQWKLMNDIPDFTFFWQDSYNIENSLIDAQHQELFNIASEAFKRVPSKDRMPKIKDTLNKLFEYFKKHFQDEEEYMEKIKYDKLHEQIKMHQDIIDDLNNFITKVSKMTIKDIENQLKEFIESALVIHILNEDKQISDWVKLKNLKELKELKEV